MVHLTSAYSVSIVEGRDDSDFKNLEIDPFEEKIYFQDNKSIYQSNYDGTNYKLIQSKDFKNLNIWAFALDWLGKRLLWVKSSNKSVIKIGTMDFKYSIDMVTNNETISSLAVDPDAG